MLWKIYYISTTELAFALPDLPKFDRVDFMMVLWPTTKLAFALPDLSKFDGVDFMMVVWPTTKSAFALPDWRVNNVQW